MVCLNILREHFFGNDWENSLITTSNKTQSIQDVANISRCSVVCEKRTEIKSLLIAFSILFLLLCTKAVFAAAGDSISSTATISYDYGGVPTVTADTAMFTEDRRINFTVTDSNGGTAVPVITDMTDAVMQFTVTNTGNGIQDFLLTVANTSPNPFGLPADNFDPLAGTVQVFVDNGVTPGYQAGQDTAVYIDELAQNASATVYVVADMPTIVIDDVAAIALIVQVAAGGAAGEGVAINADDNGHVSPAGTYSNGATNVVAGTPSTIGDTTLGEEIVFNDPAGNNSEDISSAGVQDVVTNGQHVDAGAYQVTSPVTIAKSVTVIDTLGGADPHPGATLRYQLDVSISGNVAIDDLIITDFIPANTTYTDDSILLDGVVQTDVADAPADYSRAIDIVAKPVVGIEVDLSQGSTVAVSPGATHTIIFEVTID